MPLCKLLKKSDEFIWTEEAQKALESLKSLLTSASVLVAPEQEPLFLYITASDHMVSAVLLMEREEPGWALKVQRPVYFVSEVLFDAKVYYPQVQKLLYVVLMANWKLLHYFTEHEVTIITSFTLVMGTSAGAGVVLISLEGNKLCYTIRLHFSDLNNAVEYEALINGLHITIELGATRLYIRGDSKLIVNKVMKESSYKSPLMAAYCQEVHKLNDKFRGIELHHVPRKDNAAADTLAKMTLNGRQLRTGSS
ncbi:uncharacterized protein [Setaria viridis]|uniref:uncharacterized protein n=1 Tax=Setaria viridis TaxID=4556 RepID=UPI003B3A33EE